MGDRVALLSRPGRGPLTVLAAATGVVLVLTMRVAWLGSSGDTSGSRFLALLTSGSAAVLFGGACLVTVLPRIRTRPARPARPLLALAVICWGAGELVLAASARDGRLGYPELGDGIAAAAAPIAVVAVLLAPRRGIARYPGPRLALDALATGTALTFAGWQLTGGRLAVPAVHHQASTTISFLVEFTIAAMVVLASVHDLRSRLWVGSIGVLAQTVSDVAVALNVQPGGERLLPWGAGVLSCLAWPLIGLGVVVYRPRRTQGDGDQERRDAFAATVATLGVTAALIGGALAAGLRRPADPATVTVIVLLVIVPVLCLRDLLGTFLRLDLTAGLREQAFRDGLTGLLNRWALTRRIAGLDHSGSWVVLTLNLDGFKHVNDLLGPATGDNVLIAVADALRDEADLTPRAAGRTLAARVGGDEFAVLTPGNLQDGAQLARLLQARIGVALRQEAPGLDAGVSVGVGRLLRADASQWSSGDRLSALVESAAALRAAKASGRGRIEVYAGDVAVGHQRRIRLESRLKHAIRTGAVRTHGQPIVRLETGLISGFEALARWHDEELGPVPPAEFIEVSEQTGLVVELGEQLLKATIEDAARAGVFEAGMTVAINASPVQLRMPGFVDAVRHEISRHRVRPEQLVIEVTEAILVADDDPAVRVLGELSTLGVSIAIDDFGTGYSALGYLRRLPVRVLKIDRSLTASLLHEAKTVAIVEGVVRMAHRMGMRVVMEGVENDLQADSCRAIGADHGQGWLFGRPIPWSEAASLVQQGVHPRSTAGRASGTA